MIDFTVTIAIAVILCHKRAGNASMVIIIIIHHSPVYGVSLPKCALLAFRAT